jgi:hypothetical protein
LGDWGDRLYENIRSPQSKSLVCNRPLKHGSDLLGLAVGGEEVEEVFEIANRHFKPFFGGNEGGGVEAIAFRLVFGGEVVESEGA